MGKLNKSDIDKLVGKPQVKQLELTDGNNLYLFVTKIGSCKFKYRIRTATKATWVDIGDYPDISLNDARKKALECRAIVSDGGDPNEVKKQELSKNISLAKIAELYFKDRMPLVRTKQDSANQFMRAVKRDVLDIIGNTLVPNITDELIRNKLINPKLENGNPSVARRIRCNMKILLDYAIELGIIEINPADKIKSSNLYREKPRKRYLTKDELKILFKLVYSAKIKIQHKFALHISLMLLTRKTELMHATWDCVDFEQGTFTIKESKMDKQLVIPLPKQAITLFEKLKTISQESKYIFVGRNGINEPVYKSTLNWLLTDVTH